MLCGNIVFKNVFSFQLAVCCITIAKNTFNVSGLVFFYHHLGRQLLLVIAYLRALLESGVGAFFAFFEQKTALCSANQLFVIRSAFIVYIHLSVGGIVVECVFKFRLLCRIVELCVFACFFAQQALGAVAIAVNFDAKQSFKPAKNNLCFVVVTENARNSVCAISAGVLPKTFFEFALASEQKIPGVHLRIYRSVGVFYPFFGMHRAYFVVHNIIGCKVRLLVERVPPEGVNRRVLRPSGMA